MRFRTLIAIVLACAATCFAQEHMADGLRNGILEEDSKQNPSAAIQQYQAVVTQFTEARQTAATALFRMAECWRKLGNRTAAINSYQRLLKDFPDQSKLAAQSRTVLATTYSVAAALSQATGDQNGKANFDKLMNAQKLEQTKTDEARARYRGTIEREMAIVQGQLDNRPNSTDLQVQMLHLQRDLAAFDAGMPSPAAR